MSTIYATQPLPPLFSITLTDWLPKLGEKAFLAWLRLHSWKTEPNSTSPVSLPLSLNRIIKRLRVGNSTFYDQILRPLWNFGLIDLKAAGPGQKHQLILYSYPLNNPEKGSDPLLQVRDYDFEASTDLTTVTEGDEPQKEDQASPQEEPCHATLPPLCEEPAVYAVEPNEPQGQEEMQPQSSTHQLPEYLQHSIDSNPILKERSDSIVQVYRSIRHDPRYTDEFFLHKTIFCARYQPDPRHFTAYLMKAIQNEWNTPSKKLPMKKEPTRPLEDNGCPPGMPIYVHRQLQLQKNGGYQNYPTELSPEQKAEAEELLRALGDLV